MGNRKGCNGPPPKGVKKPIPPPAPPRKRSSHLFGAPVGLNNAFAMCHPKLARGLVWCKMCGDSISVDIAKCFSSGWPLCCGETMTIDSPEERGACPSPRAEVNKRYCDHGENINEPCASCAKRDARAEVDREIVAKFIWRSHESTLMPVARDYGAQWTFAERVRATNAAVRLLNAAGKGRK